MSIRGIVRMASCKVEPQPIPMRRDAVPAQIGGEELARRLPDQLRDALGIAGRRHDHRIGEVEALDQRALERHAIGEPGVQRHAHDPARPAFRQHPVHPQAREPEHSRDLALRAVLLVVEPGDARMQLFLERARILVRCRFHPRRFHRMPARRKDCTNCRWKSTKATSSGATLSSVAAAMMDQSMP